MKLTLTPTQAYLRKQRLWRAHITHAWRVRRAFFPDTQGHPLYLHNWHICNARRDPKGAALAEWVADSLDARYRRATDRMEARDEAREHLRHTPGNAAGFWPYWCKLCDRKD